MLSEYCTNWGKLNGASVTIESRPDREAPGRTGCDAIIRRGKVPFATEITKIEPYLGMLEYFPRVARMRDSIVNHVRLRYPDATVMVTIEAERIPVGFKVQTLLDSLDRRLPSMPHAFGMTERADDLGFLVGLQKHRGTAGIPPYCGVGMYSRDTAANSQDRVIEIALRKKDIQLKPYWQRRIKTALLLDLFDFQMVNEDIAACAFALAVKRYKPRFITEVWLVRSTRKPFWILPLKLGRRVFRGRDLLFPEFMDYFRRCSSLEQNTSTKT